MDCKDIGICGKDSIPFQALESKKLWGVALDVFEGEKKYIFHDKSKEGFQEHPDLAKLATFEHVILSSHIAFYTDQVVDLFRTV